MQIKATVLTTPFSKDMHLLKMLTKQDLKGLKSMVTLLQLKLYYNESWNDPAYRPKSFSPSYRHGESNSPPLSDHNGEPY